MVKCLTADQGIANSISDWSRTFVAIGHKIVSTAILLPSVTSESMYTKYCLTTLSGLPREGGKVN